MKFYRKKVAQLVTLALAKAVAFVPWTGIQEIPAFGSHHTLDH
jgi:hypothetical protein